VVCFLFCDGVAQVDTVMDPLKHVEDDWEHCIFDDSGQSFCTENPWGDAGVLRLCPRFSICVRCSAECSAL
jgi:hypothetical protein